MTGKFRGAAHNACNLNFKQARFLPVIFHNLKGYDGHLLIQSFGKFKDQKISVIPTNSEKYISISLGRLRFLDSLQFLNASLDVLAASLDHDEFHLTNKHFGGRANLMIRKGIFIYFSVLLF